jgi:hypothetical protein
MSMSISNFKFSAVAELIGATITLPVDQAGAFTLSAPSALAPATLETVQWRHGGGWHGGWAPALSSAVSRPELSSAARWRLPIAVNGYGYPYYGGGPYGGCWRRVWGYYGWQWARVC